MNEWIRKRTVPENRTTESTKETGRAANAWRGQLRMICVSIPSVIWSLYSKSISARIEPTSSEGRIRALRKIGNSSPRFSFVTWIGPLLTFILAWLVDGDDIPTSTPTHLTYHKARSHSSIKNLIHSQDKPVIDLCIFAILHKELS